MPKRIIILFSFIFCIVFCGPLGANDTEPVKQANGFQNFLKTNVDPIIWYLYEEIHGLIGGRKKPEQSIISNHRILDLNSKFLENASAGSLFVITGTVKFLTDLNLDECRVTAKLFALGQRPIQTETAFCGNRLSADELASMEIGDIKKRLKAGGPKRLRVKKNDVQSFMVVFSHFPKDQLERFTIVVNEAADSPQQSHSP